LQFGIGATGSGCVEAQALFTNSPVTLADVGDTLSLTVTFINTSGLLTQSGAMGFGLYNSGQNYPVPGGLNGSLAGTGNATGNAQTWVGFVGQLSYTGANSQILTRPAQNGTGNNNQDAVTSGSSASFSNPAGSTIGMASAAPSVTLVAGNPYTEVLTLTLAATNTLAITNFFYSGTDTNGALLSQFGGVATGATCLTNSLDSLAIGWRAMASTYATAIDINQIAVNATFATSGPSVSLIPTNIVCQVVGGQLQLSWPQDHLGWRLQIQTNDLNYGLGTNWTTVPDSTNINSMNITINPANGAVFLRLIYP
jgi:NifU-like protein involved in Fe-S cluster formation